MLKCSCGGEFKNADRIFATSLRNKGQVVYDIERTFRGYATRVCTQCGKLRKQKLRVSKRALVASGNQRRSVDPSKLIWVGKAPS